jgi:hypothetical protein
MDTFDGLDLDTSADGCTGEWQVAYERVARGADRSGGITDASGAHRLPFFR